MFVASTADYHQAAAAHLMPSSAEEVTPVESSADPWKMSQGVGVAQTWVALYSRMSAVGRIAAGMSTSLAVAVVADHSYIVACLEQALPVGHGYPYTAVVDSCWNNLLCCMDARVNENAEGLPSGERASGSRQACCDQRKARTMCSNRMTDCRLNDHSMIQPEARSPQTTHSRAAGDAGARPGRMARSVVQTKFGATGSRFLGAGTVGRLVAAPAWRLRRDT